MEPLHLFIYGEIGGGAPSVDEIQKELTASKATDVIVHISSPGGGVFEGWTIGNILKNSGKNTTAKIEGFCASIATYIALMCNRVEMAETGRFLIHNPSLGMQGEEGDFEKAAQQLVTIKDDLVRAYRSKTGISPEVISEMMDKETSMTAEEAVTSGFVDGYMVPIKAIAKFDITKNKMPETKKVDLSVLERIIAKAEKIFVPQIMNMNVELEDGSMIFVQTEDGELEGKPAFTTDEEGNGTDTPAPDGTHALRDGRSITVEGGVVVSVQEESAEDKLTAKVAELEEALQNMQAEKDTVEAKLSEGTETLAAIMTEVTNLKKMTAGDTAAPKKVVHEPTNKFNEPATKGHSLDGFAKDLFAQYKNN